MRCKKLDARNPQKSEDEIREIILRFFYNVHKKARSLKSSRLRISAIKKNLKQRGLTEQEIVRNLDYLIQTGWILKEERESYRLQTKRGMVPVRTGYFKISDKGINHFEGISKFQKLHPPTGINIMNIQGVTIVGDGNIVNAQYSNLYRSLSLLSEEIQKSDEFSDEEKLNYIAEINTIKSQLSKTTPDKSIITRAWGKLKSLATIASIANLLEKIHVLIKMLLT